MGCAAETCFSFVLLNDQTDRADILRGTTRPRALELNRITAYRCSSERLGGS